MCFAINQNKINFTENLAVELYLPDTLEFFEATLKALGKIKLNTDIELLPLNGVILLAKNTSYYTYAPPSAVKNYTRISGVRLLVMIYDQLLETTVRPADMIPLILTNTWGGMLKEAFPEENKDDISTSSYQLSPLPTEDTKSAPELKAIPARALTENVFHPQSILYRFKL